MEPRITPASSPLGRFGDLAGAAAERLQSAGANLVEAARAETERLVTESRRPRDQLQADLANSTQRVLGDVQEVSDEVLAGINARLGQARTAIAPSVDAALATAAPIVDATRVALAPVVAQVGTALAPVLAQAIMALEPVIGPARREYEATTTPLTITPDPPAPLDASRVETPAQRQRVEATVARLPESERQAYQAVEARLRGGDEAGRPERLAALDGLQQMLINDRLPCEADSRGNTLLHNLQGIANQQNAPGVETGALLASVIRHVQDPARIEQGSFNSCGAGSSQQLFAGARPAEYARVIAALARPDGRASSQGGIALTRHAQWDRDFATGGRDVASALFQSSFMQSANLLGAVGFYQNRRGVAGQPFQNSDGVTLPGGYVLPGVLPANQAGLIGSLLGRPYAGQLGNGGSLLNSTLVVAGAERRARVDPWRTATPEAPVTIALNYGNGQNPNTPHWLAVIGYANGMVTVLNPHGQRETIPEQQVRSHLLGATYPA